MSRKVALVCENCLKPNDKVIARYRPDNPKETWEWTCSRDGGRFTSGWDQRGEKELDPAFAIEL